MARPQFEWDDGNEQHITRHGLTPAEVEAALTDPHRIDGPWTTSHGEQRREILCATPTGRILNVVVTARAGQLRVATAYPVRGRLYRLYQSRR
jgi:uncharacterized DUF497 family protein